MLSESLSQQKGNGKLIYAGHEHLRQNDIDIMGWQDMDLA